MVARTQKMESIKKHGNIIMTSKPARIRSPNTMTLFILFYGQFQGFVEEMEKTHHLRGIAKTKLLPTERHLETPINDSCRPCQTTWSLQQYPSKNSTNAEPEHQNHNDIGLIEHLLPIARHSLTHAYGRGIQDRTSTHCTLVPLLNTPMIS